MSRIMYLSGAPRVSTHPDAEASGPRAHVLGVINAFKTLGWEVTPYIIGDQLNRNLNKQASAHRLGNNFMLRLLADAARIVMSALNSRKVAKNSDVDLAYERYAVFQSLGIHLQKNRVPWILETNGIFSKEASKDRKSIVLTKLARHLEARAYRKCDVLICVSSELKQAVLSEFSVKPSKVVVVPNGVDTARFSPKKAVENYVPVIGFVGSVINWQGIDVLLRSIASLKSSGIEFKVVLVGDGPARPTLENLSKELDLLEGVLFKGHLPWDRIPDEIESFDLCYSGQVPLETGSMYHSPLKLYEYMAMAKPVVASAFDDAKRTVGKSQSGYLFTPGSVEDLSRVLMQAWAERERWPQMGAAAREHVVAEHSWEARVRAMLPEIERILEARHATA